VQVDYSYDAEYDEEWVFFHVDHSGKSWCGMVDAQEVMNIEDAEQCFDEMIEGIEEQVEELKESINGDK
jgi:hypothetical protein